MLQIKQNFPENNVNDLKDIFKNVLPRALILIMTSQPSKFMECIKMEIIEYL